MANPRKPSARCSHLDHCEDCRKQMMRVLVESLRRTVSAFADATLCDVATIRLVHEPEPEEIPLDRS